MKGSYCQLHAVASRPGLLKYNDYIFQYFPLRGVLDRVVFPRKYRPGNPALVFPGQHCGKQKPTVNFIIFIRRLLLLGTSWAANFVSGLC